MLKKPFGCKYTRNRTTSQNFFFTREFPVSMIQGLGDIGLVNKKDLGNRLTAHIFATEQLRKQACCGNKIVQKQDCCGNKNVAETKLKPTAL